MAGERLVRPTALGVYLFVMPDVSGASGRWAVVAFGRGGRFEGATTGLESRAAAARHRRRLVRHHARLAAERAARALARTRRS